MSSMPAEAIGLFFDKVRGKALKGGCLVGITGEWQKDYNYRQIAPLRIHELREGLNIKVLSCTFFSVFLH